MYHGTTSLISSIVVSIREIPSIILLLICTFFPVEKTIYTWFNHLKTSAIQYYLDTRLIRS